jgi:hypothetical protein
MRVPSKTLIKLVATVATIFQGFALYRGQGFSPMAYCGAIMLLFGGNSAHENVQKYLNQKDPCK